ncbi:MAG: VWA domain-containing protein [Bacteroidota bacterium]|nr:VWA domain-containing protein [Bacteroidota bacterium]
MMTEWWTQYEWKNPWFFLLFLILPWIWYQIKYKSSESLTILQFPNIKYFRDKINWKKRLHFTLPYLRLLVITLLILALARPQRILKEEKIYAEGINIFLVMDLSSSMLSQDFEPNRLEVSKLVAADFIQKRSYDRIGLVAFAGEGFTQCPLTTDHIILNQLLSELRCGFLDDGTAIGMGISTAINRLKNDSLSSNVIILLTDGVNNAGTISPALAAEMAQSFGIKIYSIGVGSTGEAYSPIGRNHQGEYVFGMAPVNIDESLLSQISQQTGGKYYRATSTEALKEIYTEIDQLEKTKVEVKVFKRYKDEFRFFVLLACILLIFEWLARFLLVKILK